jgi:hypothetical protein
LGCYGHRRGDFVLSLGDSRGHDFSCANHDLGWQIRELAIENVKFHSGAGWAREHGEYLGNWHSEKANAFEHDRVHQRSNIVAQQFLARGRLIDPLSCTTLHLKYNHHQKKVIYGFRTLLSSTISDRLPAGSTLRCRPLVFCSLVQEEKRDGLAVSRAHTFLVRNDRS